MFGLFMAILFVCAAIGTAIHKSIEVHENKQRAIEQGKDHYFDRNYNLVHVDDNLPYMYRYINGECYELNPYSFKIRRNITRERDAAKLRVFRKKAEESGLRFIKDITDNNTHRNFMQNKAYKYSTKRSFARYTINPYIDTITGKKYLGFSFGLTRMEGDEIPWFGGFVTKEDEVIYPMYLVNTQTGFIEGVNTDLLYKDKVCYFQHKRVKSLPTDELLEDDINWFNEFAWKHYQWEVDLENHRKEREQLEAEIQAEIRAGRKR